MNKDNKDKYKAFAANSWGLANPLATNSPKQGKTQ
jgi:hypothetical protein